MISFINDLDELKGRRALIIGGTRGIEGAIVLPSERRERRGLICAPPISVE